MPWDRKPSRSRGCGSRGKTLIVLYSGSGTGGFELLAPAYAQDGFHKLKRSAIAVLNTRQERRAADLLARFPFDLWNGSNDFNDEFCVLHALLPLVRYEEARQQSQSKDDRTAYAKVANVLTEIGPYIRFIAVSLDLSSRRASLDHPEGLKQVQIKKLVYKYIGVNGGYLGDFSYQSHADFYTDLDLDIDPFKYQGTTRERFMQIISESSPDVQARILEGVLERYPVGSTERRVQSLHDEIRGWSVGLRTGQGVEHPKLSNASETVKRALADAEHLLQKNGATSAVDRVHTALHGYQIGLCADAGITMPADASLTQVFKLLRTQHPAIQSTGPRSQDITTVLNALNAILDAMNPIRNRASVAHPNQVLLDETDARLVINVARTIFHYLDAKVGTFKGVTVGGEGKLVGRTKT